MGKNRKPLLILLAAVAGLLLVGCVNVTNLLLARGWTKAANRSSGGARRRELVRIALRETTMLALAGGGFGILLASAIVPAMQRYLPPALDFRGSLHLDWTGATCAMVLAVIATLLAGAAPAFMVSGTAPNVSSVKGDNMRKNAQQFPLATIPPLRGSIDQLWCA